MSYQAKNERYLNHAVLRWAGLVTCALYLIVMSDVIYAFPVEEISDTVQVVDEDACADMVCAVSANDEGKSTCCCNPDGRESDATPASIGFMLKDCSSPQDNDGTIGSESTKPVPQSANATPFFAPARPGTLGDFPLSFCSPYADTPDKIPI